jgi:hypothetical protein
MSDTKKEIRSVVKSIALHKRIPTGSVALIAKNTDRPDQTVRAVLYGTWFDKEILQEAVKVIKTSYHEVEMLERLLEGMPIYTDPALLLATP